jgi:hypothetical protein
VFVHYMYQQFMADDARNGVAVDEIMHLWKWQMIPQEAIARGGIAQDGPDSRPARDLDPHFVRDLDPLSAQDLGPRPARDTEILRHCIFVFADEKENLERAKAEFDARAQQWCEKNGQEWCDSESAMFVSGVSIDQVASARVLWSTYGYGAVGISFNRATAIVMLTPRRTGTTQTLGRIFRLHGDPRITRQIVDIIDASTCLKHQGKIRQEFYTEQGFSCASFPVGPGLGSA